MDNFLADNIWKAVRIYVDPYCRKAAAQAIIKVFEEHTDNGLQGFYQLQRDATAEECDIEDDWCPEYDDPFDEEVE